MDKDKESKTTKERLNDMIFESTQGLHDAKVITLTGAESAHFVDALINPPSPNEHLKKAANNHAKKNL
jgi:uncharacterized protein (DUF1778 family)